MTKTKIAKLKETLKKENPKASAEELENLLAEAIAEAEKNSTLFDEEGGKESSELAKERAEIEEERERLQTIRNMLEQGEKQLAKERAEFEEEQKRFTAERTLFEVEKEQFAAEKAENPAQQSQTATGEIRTYKCVIPCTFGGRYYREGDTLIITDGSKPTDYFKMIEK